MTARASSIDQPRRRRPRAGPLGILLAALLLLAGCSSSTSTQPVAAVTAPVPRVSPAGVAVYHPKHTPPPPVLTSCADGTASLTPPAAATAGRFPAGSDMAAIVARGKLVAGVAQDTYLWGYLNPTDNQLQGFDIDTIVSVAQALFGGTPTDARAHVDFKIVPNADRIPAVQSGQVDLVAETMTINTDRQKLVDFSSVYYCAGQRLLVPKGSPITSVDDLGGKRVCAASGSTSLDNLAGLQLAKPVIPISAENQTDCLVMLQQGRIDAVSTDDTILQGLAAQDPTLHLVGTAFTAEPYGLAISKAHPDLTRFVNGVLATDRANGTWTTRCPNDLLLNCPGLGSLPPLSYDG